MAKGIGLIGNFRGKVGNMVGYNLKDSNNKQTQGVRVYQPIVKNPKTYGQAEQRSKLAVINATYRALKMVIDRGQEVKPYGNKSRLAWLSAALKAFNGGWFEKGAAITAPALVPVTKGSLTGVPQMAANQRHAGIPNCLASDGTYENIADLSTALLRKFSFLRVGDQLTFFEISSAVNGLKPLVVSFVIDEETIDPIPNNLIVDDVNLTLDSNDVVCAGGVIVSREGSDGSHLRSTVALNKLNGYSEDLLTNSAKEAAIKSYMTGGSNTDWAEESLQG
mgnify:CR=1 FL=1